MFATDHLGRRLPLLTAVLWVIQRPMVSALFAGALFVHGAMQPKGTAIGSVIHSWLDAGGCCYSPTPTFAIIDTGGTLSLLPGSVKPTTGTTVGYVRYRPYSYDTGLWAPTRHVVESGPTIDFFAGEPTPAERQLICTLLAAELATYKGGRWAVQAPVVAAGGGELVTVLPGGYVQDLGALALAAGLVLSLRWAPKLTMAQVEMNRRNEGLCGKCAYDLRGLASKRCPECGHDPAAA